MLFQRRNNFVTLCKQKPASVNFPETKAGLKTNINMAKKQFFQESELVFKEKPTHARFQDLTGQMFGRMVVVGFAGMNHRSQWFCKCDCGKTKKILALSLKNGKTNSCGCLQKERIIEVKTKHGHAKRNHVSKTFEAWRRMLNRCQNPNCKEYNYYGGRGITVCDHWRNSFENFLADMGEKPKGLSIDRIDNNGNYCPENCRWANSKEQANNRRSNIQLSYNGKTQNISQWADELGLARGTVSSRLKRGWIVERALAKLSGKIKNR